MDKEPISLENEALNPEIQKNKYELIFSQEYLNMKPVMNSESLDIMSSEPLWMTPKNLERIKTLTKTDSVENSELVIHPLFTRVEVGGEFELVDPKDFDDVQKYLYYIKNKGSFSEDEVRKIIECSPYNHRTNYMNVLLGVSETGIMSLNNAFDGDEIKSCIVNCLSLADLLGSDVRALIYHKHRDKTDSRIPEDFEERLAECFEMSNEIFSMFTFLLAKNPNTDVPQIDSEIISYQDFVTIWERIRIGSDKLYELRGQRLKLEHIELTDIGPNDYEVELGKSLLDTGYSLLKKVHSYLKDKVGASFQ
jgi:hypothetical protein